MTDKIPDIVQCLTIQPERTVWRDFNWGFTIYRTAYGGDTEASWNTLLKNIRQNIHHNTDREPLREYGYAPEDTTSKDGRTRKKREVWESLPKARELFRLDPRSDQALLENASPDRLRELFKEGAPGPDGKPPVMHDMGTMELQGVDDVSSRTPGWRDDNLGPFVDRMFLVADAEVLDAVAAAPIDASEDDLWFRHLWVKLFAVDIDLIPEDVWVDEAICGWAKVALDMLIYVWGRATERSLDEILPRSSKEGRGLVVWNMP
ncbi:hypothetical protein RB595_010455 [Gaeumannomyces hyphopodioides]